jgi:hypothetical protein
MEDEVLEALKLIERALKDAIDEETRAFEAETLSDFKRGKLYGMVVSIRNIKVIVSGILNMSKNSKRKEKMNEEILGIRGWVQNALEGAVNERNKRGAVSDYDRGRLAGTVSAYQHVLVETSPAAAWKIPYNAFEGWINDITASTSLTIGDAIMIYDFCDSNDLLKRHNIVERVIELGLEGRTQYDITNILKLEALREAQRIRLRRGRRKYDE